MLRLILSLVLPLSAVLAVTPRVLPVLRRLKFGQTIYKLGPESHQAKQGTPTMGGLILAGVVAVALPLLHGAWFGLEDFGLILLVFSLVSMAIGFLDDYIKVVRKRSLGLVWWQKVVGQVAVGLVFSLYCYRHPLVGSRIIIPFTAMEWDLGIWYVPLMTLVIMFMINSANLQDGLDGLLASVAGVGGVAWAAVALISGGAVAGLAIGAGAQYQNLAVFSLALSGACLGYLWFNFHPARVFMGDTGSMFIGGATVGLALLLRQPLLLLLIACTMILSSLSVMMQRVYYKLTHGRRIFKMSPIHHHFELSGMTEPQIVAMYAAVTGVLSVIAALSLWPVG
ncbi:MAG: phospho-N-acetylmuramoyl-pentapeptide-transferase [Clostridiales bacterium]|nr:phospho-N-acetylmuramoyl-pentapeptide-transferase [Clostridiales bacterium]